MKPREHLRLVLTSCILRRTAMLHRGDTVANVAVEVKFRY